MFLSALSYFSNDLAIDLGTANTCVFARGRGLREDASGGIVERDMLGLEPVHPLQDEALSLLERQECPHLAHKLLA